MRQIFIFIILYTSFLFLPSAHVYSQSGEDCASAIIISSLPFLFSASNVGFKDDYNAYCNPVPSYNTNGGKDVVFLFASPTAVYVDISTCSATTNYDTKIYVYQSTCPPIGLPNPAGTEVACGDDDCSGPNFTQPWLGEITNFFFQANEFYFIVVDGWDATSTGNYTLSITASTITSDLGIDAGIFAPSLLGTSYGCLPYSQVVPSDMGNAIVTNNGTSDFNNVTVSTNIFCNFVSDSLGDTLVATFTTSSFDVLVGQSVVISAGPYTMSTDSAAVYTICFSHNKTSDDTSTNDTIYDFVYVNDSIWCNDLWLVGATADFFNITGATTESELGALYIPKKKDTLTSVTVALGIEVSEIGDTVWVCVYNTVDSGATPIAVSKHIVVDTGRIFHTFRFDDVVCMFADSVYLISVKNGNIAVAATTVLTSQFSSWGKIDANDLFGPFTGIDWMIWANLGEVVNNNCIEPASPTTNNIELFQATLNWSDVPGALGYEISGGLQGTSQTNYVVITINNPTATSHTAILLNDGTTYEWRVRAACDWVDGAVVWGPYSDLVFFTTLACGSVTPISTSPVTSNSAKLNWTPTPAAIGYRILGQKVGGSLIELDIPGVNSNSFDATNLKSNTSYLWGVFAICSQNPFINGPFSGGIQFTTLGPNAKTKDLSGFSEVTIFPNPATDVFTIAFAGEIDLEDIEIRISDISGRQYMIGNSIHQNSIQFSGAGLSNGVYQVYIKSNDLVITRKLIIEK